MKQKLYRRNILIFPAMCKASNKYVVKQKLKKLNSNVYGYSLLESLRKNDVLNIEGMG